MHEGILIIAKKSEATSDLNPIMQANNQARKLIDRFIKRIGSSENKLDQAGKVKIENQILQSPKWLQLDLSSILSTSAITRCQSGLERRHLSLEEIVTA